MINYTKFEFYLEKGQPNKMRLTKGQVLEYVMGLA
jgi:hypothetical protein